MPTGIEMPGCVELGVRVFSECCALECVRKSQTGSYLALGAVIGQYAFEECAIFSTSTDAVWAWCPGHR